MDSTGTVAKLQARLKEAVIARRIRAWGLLETHYNDIVRCADDGWVSPQLLDTLNGKWQNTPVTAYLLRVLSTSGETIRQQTLQY